MKPDQKKFLFLYGALLAEDEKLKLDLEKNFFVKTCERGEDLIQELWQHQVAIILFQINLNNSEIENLRKIWRENKNVPIIVLGSGRKMETVAQAFQDGAIDFFRIPYQLELLVERIRFLAGIRSG